MEEVKVILNKFVNGVNSDIAEDSLPNGFLSNGHNIKFTNDDNKQGIVQKQESYIKELNGYGANLKPLAAKVFNNVIYIVSYNTFTNLVEYGTYPSADLTTAPAISDTKSTWTRPKLSVYAPLPNYKTELVAYVYFNDILKNKFYNIPYSGQSVTVKITTSTGVNWIATPSSGLVLSQSTGASGSNMTITVPINITTDKKEYTIDVIGVGGTIVTQILLSQPRCNTALGFFSTDTLNGEMNISYPIGVTYTPGPETPYPSWSIVRQLGYAVVMSFTPPSNPSVIVGYSTVMFRLNNYAGYSGTYSLVDTSSGLVLDRITVTIGSGPPSVELYTISSYGDTYADLHGVANAGGLSLIRIGFIWSQWSVTGDPSTPLGIDDDYPMYNLAYNDGRSDVSPVGEGSFYATITELSPNTKYRVRAYAENSEGMSYSYNNKYVTTLELLPSLTLPTITNITSSTATLTSSLADVETAVLSEQGFCWNISGNPTIASATKISYTPIGIGTFSSNITLLNNFTTYYVRSYAITNDGTSYSSQASFKTLSSVPIVTSSNAIANGSTAGQCSGNIISNGGKPVTARGIYFYDPIADTHTYISAPGTPTGGTESFTVSFSALTASTEYLCTAYALNSDGYGFGTVISFTTDAPGTPELVMLQVTDITTSSVSIRHGLSNSGTQTIIEHGIAWKATTSIDPTESDTHTILTNTVGEYNTNISGLIQNTAYRVRAYFKTLEDSTYKYSLNGSLSFTTAATVFSAPVLDNLVTIPSVNITNINAIIEGEILSNGNDDIITHGFVWSLSANPTIILSTKTSYGYTLPSTFSGIITPLLPETLYHVRAYATNSYGTSYSGDWTFTTINTLYPDFTGIVTIIPSDLGPSYEKISTTGVLGSGDYSVIYYSTPTFVSTDPLHPEYINNWSATNTGNLLDAPLISIVTNTGTLLNSVYMQVSVTDNVTQNVVFGRLTFTFSGLYEVALRLQEWQSDPWW